MAECIMADIVKKHGLQSEFRIASAATSCEEEGNPIYPPARRKLNEKGVEVLPHCATVLTRDDKSHARCALPLRLSNRTRFYRIIGESDKVHRLLDFSSRPRDIADPWWTGDFETTYNDIVEGCDALLDYCVKSYNEKNG